ncbi:hypothetical protein SSS_08280 [Sarcoptes scabiei]|uniref:Uncharacterized protein n=1 Tax=Sarcoptes scabiei TaxID=52283 RepID=A0A834VCG1_SARSC|nr:hypothetical protein SSS_08280 [Sarcoptes scabiei]
MLFTGQFSFEAGYPRFKLPGPLGQLISGQGLNLGSMNSGFGQILGSLISNAGSSSNSGGGPLSQLATAASTQYINAVRSSPLFSQFTGSSSQSMPSSGPASPIGPGRWLQDRTHTDLISIQCSINDFVER